MRSPLRRAAALLVGCALFLATFDHATCAEAADRHVSNRELTMEKSGRVIDADTGAGIAGANVIVNWRTHSTGVAGYPSTGGTWCDLQRIVATDEAGNYTVPDDSKELDLSDRGTRVGVTVYGVATQTHDKDYVLTVFKPGYEPAFGSTAADPGRQRTSAVAARPIPTVPAVSFAGGKVRIKTIALTKASSDPVARWNHYSEIGIAGRCSDRMAHAIEQPEFGEMLEAVRTEVRPMPCAMAPETAIDPESSAVFESISHTPLTFLAFHNRVRQLEGLPPPARGYDPTERISTTAGTLCRALKAEEAN